MSTTVSTRIVTIPNALSALRLLLVPVFLALLIGQQWFWALATLVFSSITDFVDGQVARRFNQITRLGQLLDPAADRLYIVATLIGLAGGGILPWWLVAVVLARDLMLVVLGVVLANHRLGPLPTHHLGKVATFTLLFALPTLVIGAAFPDLQVWAGPLGWAAAIWGAFLYWAAGLVYLAQAVRLVRTVRTSGATASDTLGEDEEGRS
ncbi:MAG: CDP-alcohol phosphatidyltransferase family protein [Actinomycetales bacterium]|nr:CDP-alcohol phosphatidyltransferase family protein [Actinomycetales bacterium]